MPTLFAGQALLLEGWRASVNISTATDSAVAAVEPDAEPLDAKRTAGPVVPGGVRHACGGHNHLEAEAVQSFAQAVRTLAGSAELVA